MRILAIMVASRCFRRFTVGSRYCYAKVDVSPTADAHRQTSDVDITSAPFDIPSTSATVGPLSSQVRGHESFGGSELSRDRVQPGKTVENSYESSATTSHIGEGHNSNENRSCDADDPLLTAMLLKHRQSLSKSPFVYANVFTSIFERLKPGVQLSPHDGLLLLSCCGKRLLTKGVEFKVSAQRKILDVLSKSGHLSIAHFNLLLLNCLEIGAKFSPADVIEKIASANIKPDQVTFERLLMAYCKSGDMNTACNVISLMKQSGVTLSATVFNSLAEGYCFVKDYAQVSSILALMVEKDCPPTYETYIALAGSAARSGDTTYMLNAIESAKGLQFVKFHRKGCLDIARLVALSGHEIGGLLDEAQVTPEYCRDALLVISELLMLSLVSPACAIFASVVKHESDAADLEFFLGWLAQFDNEHFQTVIAFCIELEKRSLLLGALEKLLWQAYVEQFDVAFGALQYFLDKAEQLLKSAQELNKKLTIEHFRPLLVRKAKSAATDNSLFQLLEMMQACAVSVDDETLHGWLLPHSQVSFEQLLQRTRLLDHLKPKIDEPTDPMPSVSENVSNDTESVVHLNNQHPQQPIVTMDVTLEFQRMIEHAMSLLPRNKPEVVLNVFNNMKRSSASDNILNCADAIESVINLLLCASQVGGPALANRVFDEMLFNKILPLNAVALSCLIKAHLRRQNFSVALDAFEHYANEYNILAHHYALCDKLLTAKQIGYIRRLAITSAKIDGARSAFAVLGGTLMEKGKTLLGNSVLQIAESFKNLAANNEETLPQNRTSQFPPRMFFAVLETVLAAIQRDVDAPVETQTSDGNGTASHGHELSSNAQAQVEAPSITFTEIATRSTPLVDLSHRRSTNRFVRDTENVQISSENSRKFSAEINNGSQETSVAQTLSSTLLEAERKLEQALIQLERAKELPQTCASVLQYSANYPVFASRVDKLLSRAVTEDKFALVFTVWCAHMSTGRYQAAGDLINRYPGIRTRLKNYSNFNELAKMAVLYRNDKCLHQCLSMLKNHIPKENIALAFSSIIQIRVLKSDAVGSVATLKDADSFGVNRSDFEQTLLNDLQRLCKLNNLQFPTIN